MLKVENIVPPSSEQFGAVIRGMRHAFKSYDKSDSKLVSRVGYTHENAIAEETVQTEFNLGDNDKLLAINLVKAGNPSHRKFLRQLPIILEIKAPEYWWRQMDAYKIGVVMNSTSQMHNLISKPFSSNDFSIEHVPGYKYIPDQKFPEFTQEELDKEEWVDLGNGYTVSNLGRMTGILTDILKPVVCKDGYVSQYMKGKQYRLHRIVASEFCPKRPGADIVNHKNGNKLDNRASNLEWVTQKENIEHSRKNKLQGPQMKPYKGKFTEEQRNKIFEEWESGNYSKRQLAEKWGVSHTCINEMINGVHKYQDKVNVFEDNFLPLVNALNELRSIYQAETNPEIKEVIWHQILELIPQSYNYTRTVSLNYEVALQIIEQRKGHKLDEWEELIEALLKVPFMREFAQAAGLLND